MEPAPSQGIAPPPRVTDQAEALPACTATTNGQRAIPSASLSDTFRKSRNVRLASIGYAFPPRLRDRLTLGGRTWPRKPWIYGGRDSHPPCRYSCLHGLPDEVQRRFRSAFSPRPALSYQPSRTVPRFRLHTSVPIIFGAGTLGQWAITRSSNDGCL